MKRSIKRMLALALCLVLCAGLLPGTARAAEIVDSGTCGENLTWVLDSEGTLTISGTGEMEDYNCPWVDQRSFIQAVIISEGVTSIGDTAFYQCSKLSSVSLPDSLESIGSSAFAMSSLKSVSLPPKLTTIGFDAFSSTPIQSVTIPKGVQDISANPFSYCGKLAEILVEDGNEKYYSLDGVLFRYFSYSAELVSFPGNYPETSYTVPDTLNVIQNGTMISPKVDSIGSHAFHHCQNLKSVVLPDTVEEIGWYAFGYCSNLKNVAIPDKMDRIESSAFSRCEKLSEIKLPDGIASIEWGTFDGCSVLSAITIPTSIIKIEASAFDDCKSLSDVYFPGTEENWAAIDIHNRNDSLLDATIHYNNSGPNYSFYPVEGGNIWFDLDTGTVAICEPGVTRAVIPDIIGGVNVKALRAGAFSDCSDLTEVILPNGITKISESAFADCKKLQKVNIPNGVTEICTDAFKFCSSLQEIMIPDSVTSIGRTAFYACHALETVHLGNGLESIERWAFGFCDSLTEITIPSKVSSIDAFFSSCSKLSKISVDAGNTSYCAIDDVLFTIDKETLVSYPGGKCGSVYAIPAGVKLIAKDAFNENKLLKNVLFAESVTEIGPSAFESCDDLTEVTLPYNVFKIGSRAFSFCKNLKSVIILGPIERIMFDTFISCRKLKSIFLPASVKIIDGDAFWSCENLKTVFYGGMEEQWNEIDIDPYNNEPLLNAVIHYESNGIITPYDIELEPVVDASAPNAPEARLTLTGPEDLEAMTVYGVRYSAEGQMLGLVSMEVQAGETGELTVPFADGSYIRFFALDAADQTPVCASVRVDAP